MRRSFHLRRVQRFSASVSRYRLPHTSPHALHHHRLGAASRSPQAHLRQVVQARPGVVVQPGHLQGGPPRCAASPHFARKMSLLSAAQNFLDGESRAQKQKPPPVVQSRKKLRSKTLFLRMRWVAILCPIRRHGRASQLIVCADHVLPARSVVVTD